MNPKQRHRAEIDALRDLIGELQRELAWWHERFPKIAEEMKSERLDRAA